MSKLKGCASFLYLTSLKTFCSIFAVETCDERKIPTADHASFKVDSYYNNGASKQSLRRENFIPRYVFVKYTCDKGYYLDDPDNNLIGCEYATKPSGLRHVTVKAAWKSAESINCMKGKKQSMKVEANY